MLRVLALAATLCAALDAALASPLSAQGPNLLPNASLDASTAGWVRFLDQGELTWAPTDVAGNPRSGSMRLSSTGGTSEVQAESVCVPLTPGQTYALGGRAWMDPATHVSGDVTFVAMNIFGDDTCSFGGGLYQLGGETGARDAGSWQAFGGFFRAEPFMKSLRVRLFTGHQPGNTAPLATYFDDLYLRAGGCAANPDSLCLGGGRFRVFLTWQTDTDLGHGRAVPFSDDAGHFWFFSPQNLEISVKVIDGCALNGRFWVFASGLTNVAVLLSVQDMQTGEYWGYTNPRNQTFVPVTDTDAFATCP
jgi:hypothetical protein